MSTATSSKIPKPDEDSDQNERDNRKPTGAEWGVHREIGYFGPFVREESRNEKRDYDDNQYQRFNSIAVSASHRPNENKLSDHH